MDRLHRRPARLDEGPLDYEPVNELGVVFLFSYLARRRRGLCVEAIRAGFTDCIAYQEGKKVRLEFEYGQAPSHRGKNAGAPARICLLA